MHSSKLPGNKVKLSPLGERFFELANRLLLTAMPSDHHERKELNQLYWNELLDLPGPRTMQPKGRPEDKFYSRLLNGWVEIQSAYFTICRIPVYFRRLPRGLGNESSHYLTFLVHAYLNQAYVLEERMHFNLKALLRAAHKNSEVRIRLEKAEPGLKAHVSQSFNNVRQTRGSHVHGRNFREAKIDRLGLIELFSQIPNLSRESVFTTLKRSALRDAREYWNGQFEKNETVLHDLIEHYFDVIIKAVCDEKGDLRKFLDDKLIASSLSTATQRPPNPSQ